MPGSVKGPSFERYSVRLNSGFTWGRHRPAGQGICAAARLDHATTQFAGVIASNRYALVASYADNFTEANGNNRGPIYEVRFSGANKTGGQDFPGAAEGNERAQFFGPSGIGFTDVSLTPLTGTFTPTTMRRPLRHERIAELAGEGIRWRDPGRCQSFKNAADLSELRARDAYFNNFISPRNEFRPIPQTEIDIDKNLPQNSHY
jgi:hypothetical protein